VGGLPAGEVAEPDERSMDTTMDDFSAALFSCCGELKTWDRAREPVTKRMLTFARAVYVVPEAAIVATDLLDNMEVDVKGRKFTLSVKAAKEDLEYIEELRSGRAKSSVKAEDENSKVPGLLPVPPPTEPAAAEAQNEETAALPEKAVKEEGEADETEAGELRIDESENGGKTEPAADDYDVEDEGEQDPQGSEDVGNHVLAKFTRKGRKRIKKLMRALKEKSWRKWASKRLPEVPKVMEAEARERKLQRERRLQRVLGVEDLESFGDENARQVTEAALESLSVYGVTQQTVQADLSAYVKRLKEDIRARQRKRITYIEDQVRRLKKEKAEAAKRALEGPAPSQMTTMENGAVGVVAAQSAPSGARERDPSGAPVPGEGAEPGPEPRAQLQDSARRSGVSNLPAWMTRGQGSAAQKAPPARPESRIPGFVAASSSQAEQGAETFHQRKKPRIDLGPGAHPGAATTAPIDGVRRTVPQRELSKEELRQLADSIPSSSDELFGLTVDWDAIQASGVLDTRIKDWVARKFSEYLGEADETMTTFVQGALQERSTPDAIIKELALVLEDDAEVFVTKLWRMVVFEAKRYRASV